MISAPHDKEFVFHDGSRAKNLLELVLKLEHMGDHEFHQFVTPSKNDFANWTEHVLHDVHLADRLRVVMSKNETIHLIKDKVEETTIGNSIIKIPRLEDRSERHSEHNATEHHETREEHKEKHDEPQIKTVDNHSNEKHGDEEHNHGKHIPDHLPNHASIIDKEKNQEKSKEKSVESKTKHHWFQLFSNKGVSKSKLEKIERKEEDKLSAEREIQEELEQDGRENALWVILYFALVLLIITLLVFKLFL